MLYLRKLWGSVWTWFQPPPSHCGCCSWSAETNERQKLTHRRQGLTQKDCRRLGHSGQQPAMYKCHIRKNLLAPQQVCQLCNLEGRPWGGECKSHRCWRSVDTLEEEGHNVMWRAKDAASQMRERQRNRGPRIVSSIFSGKFSFLVGMCLGLCKETICLFLSVVG